MEENNTPVTEQLKEEVKEEVRKRPTFLAVLCILTFIGSGLGLLFSLLALVAFGAIQGMLETLPITPELGGSSMLLMAISVILSAGSLFGAILMWQLKKVGFFLYVAAQVIMLIVGFTVFSLIITALFVILYALNLKHLK